MFLRSCPCSRGLPSPSRVVVVRLRVSFASAVRFWLGYWGVVPDLRSFLLFLLVAYRSGFFFWGCSAVFIHTPRFSIRSLAAAVCFIISKRISRPRCACPPGCLSLLCSLDGALPLAWFPVASYHLSLSRPPHVLLLKCPLLSRNHISAAPQAGLFRRAPGTNSPSLASSIVGEGARRNRNASFENAKLLYI